jgi:hypothetical protein
MLEKSLNSHCQIIVVHNFLNDIDQQFGARTVVKCSFNNDFGLRTGIKYPSAT